MTTAGVGFGEVVGFSGVRQAESAKKASNTKSATGGSEAEARCIVSAMMARRRVFHKRALFILGLAVGVQYGDDLAVSKQAMHPQSKIAFVMARFPRRALACCFALWLASSAVAGPLVYQKPPPDIAELLSAPDTPQISLSPARDRMLLVQGLRHPSIVELAGPMVRLAGQRVNPQNNGPHGAPGFVGITLKMFADGKERKVVLPDNARVSFPAWSPDGKLFAVVRYGSTQLELLIGDAQSGQMKALKGAALNGAFGEVFQWMPDSQHILCKVVPAKRGKPPVEPLAPVGPVVQESGVKAAPVWTYQDLLQSTHDEELFDHYLTSQFVLVNARSGQVTPLGKPGVFSAVEPSPDGRFLLVESILRPYSQQVPITLFPKKSEVWDRAGQVVKLLAEHPSGEHLTLGGVTAQPRGHHWQPIAPATLAWIEALDGGDPRAKVEHRDRVLLSASPFVGEPREMARIEHRFSALTWGEDGRTALLREFQSSRRWYRTWLFDLDKTEAAPRLLWSLSSQERFNHPGTPLLRYLLNGKRVMRMADGAIFLTGLGASPEGDRPFLDRLDLTTLETQRLFRCDEASYESVVAFVKNDGSQFITRRETAAEPPNYFLHGGGAPQPLTQFRDPFPQFRAVKKQLVTYQREDGVPLSFTLYLPPGHELGKPLPTILWAYPREFTDSDLAAQQIFSPHRFTRFIGSLHIFFALRGYAVLDNASLPVIGDPRTANDTFVPQIVAGAKAAVDKAVELGVTDPRRVGVAGHSYGAFMTANLLAHTDLFRAGVARSGAYNRTLTPFGFQSERRTLWEAPETYFKISPLLHADKLKKPLLLIHGEMDNNPGTFPEQSERLFHALNGTGGTARLVMLPFESHNYIARESVGHTLHEMLAWFDKHVKNADNASPGETAGK